MKNGSVAKEYERVSNMLNLKGGELAYEVANLSSIMNIAINDIKNINENIKENLIVSIADGYLMGKGKLELRNSYESGAEHSFLADLCYLIDDFYFFMRERDLFPLQPDHSDNNQDAGHKPEENNQTDTGKSPV